MNTENYTIPENETYLNQDQVAARYPGVKARTLESWRVEGAKRIGPPYIKVGAKVYYPLSLLIQWERENLRTFDRSSTK